MPADFAAYQQVAKEVWTPDALQSQLVSETPTLAALGATDEYNVGAVAKTPVYLQRGTGVRMIGDNEDSTATAGKAGVDKASWNYKHFTAQVKVYHTADVATANKKVAVVSAVQTEMEDGIDQVAEAATRQLWDAGTGYFSGVASGTQSSVNTINLDARGIEWLNMGIIRVGHVVDIGTTSNGQAIAQARTITAVGASSITISGATVTVTGGTHFIAFENSVDGSGNSRELTAFEQICGSGALGGLTHPRWVGANLDISTTSVLLSHVGSAQTKIQRGGGKRGDLLIGGPEQRDNLYQQLQIAERFTGDNGVKYGEVEGTAFGSLGTYVVDARAPLRKLFVLTGKDLFFVGAQTKPQWMNPDQPLTYLGKASVEGTLVYDINLVTTRRNAQAGFNALT